MGLLLAFYIGNSVILGGECDSPLVMHVERCLKTHVIKMIRRCYHLKNKKYNKMGLGVPTENRATEHPESLAPCAKRGIY